MGSGQRELGVLTVIEAGARPVRGGVADAAIRWESCLGVAGIGGRLEKGEMAAAAVRG